MTRKHGTKWSAEYMVCCARELSASVTLLGGGGAGDAGADLALLLGWGGGVKTVGCVAHMQKAAATSVLPIRTGAGGDQRV